MKKITFILIANILLILSIAFSFDELSIFNFNINNYEKVETTKEAENVLTSLKKMMSKVENGGMYYDLENSEEIPSFDNMTFLSKSEFKLDYSTRSTDAKGYLNRTLKAYFTSEGIHYMVDLYAATYKKPKLEQYNSNGETMEADYEIFVTEKDIYIKFNSLIVTRHDGKLEKDIVAVISIFNDFEKAELKGKWIRCEDMFFTLIDLVSEYNNNFFDSIRETLVSYNNGKEIYDKIGDEYRMKADYLYLLFDGAYQGSKFSMFDDDDYEGDFILTLNNSNGFNMDFFMTFDAEIRREYSDDLIYHETYSGYENNKMGIINIGNTSVNKINDDEVLDYEYLLKLLDLDDAE